MCGRAAGRPGRDSGIAGRRQRLRRCGERSPRRDRAVAVEVRARWRSRRHRLACRLVATRRPDRHRWRTRGSRGNRLRRGVDRHRADLCRSSRRAGRLRRPRRSGTPAVRPPRRTGDRAGDRRVPMGRRQPSPHRGQRRAAPPMESGRHRLPPRRRPDRRRRSGAPTWPGGGTGELRRARRSVPRRARRRGHRRDRPRPRRRPRTRRPCRGTRRVGGMRRDPDRPAHPVRDAGADPRSDAARCRRDCHARRRSSDAIPSRAGGDRPNSTTRSPIRRARRSSARPTRMATRSSSCIPTPTRGTAAAW